MQSIRWIWNDEKARANLIKHEVAFSEAVEVFKDPLHASRPDPHPDGDRWQSIGRVGLFLLLVIHTIPVEWEPEGKSIGRIISARMASSTERKAYEDGDF